MARRLPDYIEAFEKYAATYNSTPLFARAAGMWMLGTTVGRSVGMRARANYLFPNLYMQMVGGPGAGKSQAVNAVRSIMMKLPDISFIPASVTRAGLEDYMAGNLKNRKAPDGGILLSSECLGLSEEMQGILPDQDVGHLTLYNQLFDLPPVYKARTRTHGEVIMESPYCSIFTGAQPAFLAQALPEAAWGMGFMSRSIMVFDIPRERKSLFIHDSTDPKLYADLIHDLRILRGMYGWMTWEPKAIQLYDEWWVRNGGLPIPSAKRLTMGYNARREMHFAKFAMIMCLSRAETEQGHMLVTIDDVARAIEMLLALEAEMKNIFNEMAATGSMVALNDILDVVRANSASGKETDEAFLIEALMQRFPSTQVHSLVQNMIASGAIKLTGGLDARGFRKFSAGDRTSLM